MDWKAFAGKLLLADGRVGEAETKALRQAILSDGKVKLDEAAFLLELKQRATAVHRDLEHLVEKVIAAAVLRDGVIDPSEVDWLRKLIFVDKVARHEEVAFLRTLIRRATRVCPEFLQLLDDCQKAALTTDGPAAARGRPA